MGSRYFKREFSDRLRGDDLESLLWEIQLHAEGEYAVYPEGAERGAELLFRRAGIYGQDLCLWISGEELVAEGRDIQEQHVGGEAADTGLLVLDHGGAVHLQQELPEDFRYQLIGEVEQNIHRVPVLRYTMSSKELSVRMHKSEAVKERGTLAELRGFPSIQLLSEARHRSVSVDTGRRLV